MRKLLVSGVLLAVIAGGATAYQQGWFESGLPWTQAEAAPDQTPPAARLGQPVEVARAREVMATTDIRSVGSLQSDESVQLASEVSGRIAEIRFSEGEQIKAGDVLVKLDDALARASLEEAEVRLDLSRQNYERAQRLSSTGTGTARALDEATAEQRTATALLNRQQVEVAKHEIIAPFDGVTGLRTVSVGAYIAVGTPLINIEKIDTLKVDFKVPEARLRDVAPGQSVEVIVDAYPGRTFTATIYAIDPMVDVNGRALSIRARLPNDDLVLRPGLFVRVLVKGGTERSTVMVPESAVVPRGQERFVWLVEDGKAVETRVTLGERRAGEVELSDGVAAGSTVVVAGHARLRTGTDVDVISDEAQFVPSATPET